MTRSASLPAQLDVGQPLFQIPAPLRPTAVSPARLLAWIGLVASLAGLVALVVGLPPPVRLDGLLALAVAGPGCAVMAHLRPTDRVVDGAVAIVISLSVVAAGSLAMVWTSTWAPTGLLAVVAGLSAASCLVALRRPATAGGNRAMGAPLSAPARHRWVRRTAIDSGVIAAALAAWIVALATTTVAGVGQGGLLSVLSPFYYVALLLTLGGFVTELARGARRGGALAAYLGMLILLLHGTTAALLDRPEYAWTYKHIGVVELFASGHHIGSTRDIYQQWPAFFTTTAELSGPAGMAPIRFAAWAPVAFNLLGSLILLAIARVLTTDRRIAFGTVLVFQCINWIEEDYLSPQGFAFVLSLGIFLIALRWLRVSPPPVVGGRRHRLASWLRTASPPAPMVSPRARGVAVAGLLSVLVVVTAAHQLSPYLVALSLVALVVVGVVRPWWVALAAVAIPVLYLVPRYASIAGSFDIFNGLNLFSNASGTASGWGTIGQAVSALTVRALTLVVWATVALSAWHHRRVFGRVLIPVALAIVPFGLLFAQNYGGEAIYRVFLFSAPWSAFLIADLVAHRGWGQRHDVGRRRVTVAVSTLVLALSALATGQGRHGQLTVDQQGPADVAAAQYLYSHGEPGATVVLATPTFPSRVSAGYVLFNTSVPAGEPDLVKGAKLRGPWDARTLPAIQSYAASFDGTTTYLVVSDAMRRQAHYFGYLPDGSLDSLAAALRNSPQWSTFYQAPGVVIFQFTP